ncbi:hypothetical protein D9M69_507270 [compost metagenome]
MPGARAVPPLQHLRDGIDPQAQQGLGQEQVQHDDAQAQSAAEPETRDAMDVPEAYRSDGAGAAQHRRGHGPHVEGRPQVAAGDQKLLSRLGAFHAVPTQQQHRRCVGHDDDDVQNHVGSPLCRLVPGCAGRSRRCCEDDGPGTSAYRYGP